MSTTLAQIEACLVCGNQLTFQWSDTHGIGCCTTCGMPYRFYHYEDNKRVDKPPEPTLTEAGVEVAKRYWNERRRRVFPACHDMGVERGGRSYSGATSEDVREFGDWYKREYPPAPSAGGGEK